MGQIRGYHGMFEEYIPLIRRLQAQGDTPSQIANQVPPVGQGAWRTQCSPEMVHYIMRRERIGQDPNFFQPNIINNEAFIFDFKRRTAKWDGSSSSWFELHAEKLFLELAGIIKALEMRAK
jgi:hypothetical protein